MRLICSVLVLIACLDASVASAARTVPSPAPAPSPSPSPADPTAARTATLTHFDGFLPLHWDDKEGKLLMEVPRPGQELIYQVSLASGVGSNPIGLDRNQLGDTRLVRFDRVGPRLLMVQE